MIRLYVVTFNGPLSIDRITPTDRVSFIVTGNTRRSAARTAYAKLGESRWDWSVHEIRPATKADRAAWQAMNADHAAWGDERA